MKEGGTESEECIIQCMQIESTIMIRMLVLNLNLKSVLLFPSSELVGFLSLDSLVRHHLRLDHSDQCFPPLELAGILCLNSLVVHHLRVI